MPYKLGVPKYRWKVSQGQSIIAGVAVGSQGADMLVMHTDQVRQF
jgi:hypothetical protein